MKDNQQNRTKGQKVEEQTKEIHLQGLLQGRRGGVPGVRRDAVGVVPRGGEVEGGPGLEGAAPRRPTHPLRPPRQQERHGRIAARKSNFKFLF